MAKKIAIVWFRKDLRLADHPALVHACQNAEAVLPLYIWSPEEEGEWCLGGASKWWLHHSLGSLQKELKTKQSKLILKSGASLEVLKELIQKLSVTSVFWNRRYEPMVTKRDAEIKKELKALDVEVKSFNGSLLYEPWLVRNKQGKPYKVYTPFWNAVTADSKVDRPVAVPRDLKPLKKWPSSLSLTDIKLLPKIKWDVGFQKLWNPGRKGALQSLSSFSKNGVADYAAERDRPDHLGTSRLSPHLHFGEISPREVWHKIKKNTKTIPYLRQLIWREFAYHLLYHFPETPLKPLDVKFKRFPWKKSTKLLKAWQKGETGYPIVDAGMRELWSTGWMHNRVRMIVASFLVKDLLIPWQEGAKWFWDTLVDADLANNTMGWQWVAGCGADASPFFRIFNPMTQGEKFDPNGEYVKKWVPELCKVSVKYLHKPWLASEQDLKQAGVVLGRDYPKPIVDHERARRLALDAYDGIKQHA